MGVATGAIDMPSPSPSWESLAKRYPKLELHLTCNNYGTHKYRAVKQWLAADPRFQLYFTPTNILWLNLVRRWFGRITSQPIRRGRFDSIARVEHAIPRFLANWNDPANLSAGLNPLIRSCRASVMLHLF
jgi:hypothetical protein